MLKEHEAKFTKRVEDREGMIISDGVLNVEILLTRLHEYILDHRLDDSLLEKIEKLYDIDDEYYMGSLDDARYHGKASFKESLQSNDSEVIQVYEEVAEYLDSLSPNGYYFGSSYGDGALIGYFKLEDEIY